MPTLDWIGKKAVVNHHREVPYRLIHCDKEKSVGDPDAGNLLVQGDNLEALKALLPYYAGKVKCIYLDPPYNTGNEGWIYNDNVNLLSNAGVVPWELFGSWVREAVGVRREIVVAMDWTDFDADNQATLAQHLVTRHGRATPLLWLTVDKDELKNQRNDFEDLCLTRLKDLLPEGVAVTIPADRGFGDVKLFAFLESLGFDYVIRFRGDINVSAADGETRRAADWVGRGGRARTRTGVRRRRFSGHAALPPPGRRRTLARGPDQGGPAGIAALSLAVQPFPGASAGQACPSRAWSKR